MTDVVRDFDALYANIADRCNLSFFLNCNEKSSDKDCVTSLHNLRERKSYFCCAVDARNRCVLHKCLLVVFGTQLDLRFRRHDEKENNSADAARDVYGTFMIDGRHLSFPNIMMNNNVLMHNFYDKLYSKSCKRMFLYGNVDEEKQVNRAIQLVYNEVDNVLFARDVYARDYVVTGELNKILHAYLKHSGKWEPLNFLFNFSPHQSASLVEQIKRIMRVDINYSIDSLANKIIYKQDYLLSLLYKPLLDAYATLAKKENDTEATGTGSTIAGAKGVKRKKIQSVMFPRECKKIVETIVNGRLIYVVSKTFSKQKKNFINYQDNSSNNNIEIVAPVLKYRIGNEVVRITNETMRQDMLMQKSDFVKFVDSFFHGEMTVAGKKFFLCRDVRLPGVDYQLVADKFLHLEASGLIERVDWNDDDADGTADEKNESYYRIAFNDRPTVFACQRKNLDKLFYIFKRNQSPVELKLQGDTLFVNHHEGMICIKRRVKLRAATIVCLLTPHEYHNSASLLNTVKNVGRVDENDDVTSLMSKLVQYYYKNHTGIFSTLPVPKLIVSLTNLKNAMPVQSYTDAATQRSAVFLEELPAGNSVVVAPRIMVNNKMFKLWTLVRDHRLMTAEDPYIPHISLPVSLYNNKVNKLKGKIICSKTEKPRVKFVQAQRNNCIEVDGGNLLHAAGMVVSSVKIAWIYDGKRYKIETCKNKNHYVFKMYLYLRKLKGQRVERLHGSFYSAGDTVHLKITTVCSTNDLRGIKICGIHGQKGVLNGSDDLTEWMAEDGTHAQICLAPISYLSRQSNFDSVETKYAVRGGDHSDPNAERVPMFNIPYMVFNNTPDNIYKEFIKSNHTGHEKIEGTRLDQWTINQSFAGNRWTESLQWVRGSSNLPDDSGEFKVLSSLLHCNNTIIK
uniref:Late expression factor 8 n=1 Tax=Lymantria dispar multicapsid nuclear polyhedrosis virus TaxID=10449 RepID=A0A1B1MQR9_NPVLD|nr:late expression factor 8 [Lymantria dispar multiple nucleopolyhedrovirus]